MDHELLTTKTLLDILKTNGFETTKASLSRYMQDGLVLRPKQKPIRREKEERAYFNPICIIEVMTAILLFRGDYLEYKSAARIARLTDKDLFLGRLSYYTRNFPSSFNVYLYHTSIEKHEIPEEGFLEKLDMDRFAMEQYLHFYRKKCFDIYGVESMHPLAESYASFVGEIYTKTFNYLLDRYGNKLYDLEHYIDFLKHYNQKF